MPKVSELFRPKYVRLEDLQGKAHLVTVARVVKERVDDDTLWIAYFEGKKKGLVLRQMISQEIAGLLGDDTDGWKGQEFELYVGAIMLRNGDVVDGFRARKPLPPGTTEEQPEF